MKVNLKENEEKVLVIDKDKSVTSILSNRLKSVGINVLTAADEDSAFDVIRTNRPDIILLDILMKSKSGEDLLNVLTINQLSSNIPIIILSSAIDVNSKVYGFLSGASDYIVKPFRFAEVYARIKNQLRIISMQSELEKKNRELVEKNLLLQQMTVTDGLTGLYNKRYILSRLVNDITHASKYQESISFIMVDIDHFKHINDTYGHLVGDMLLKEVAHTLKNMVRDVDIMARYGGEEFLIVVPNEDLIGTKILAERLRQKIEKTSFPIDNHQLKITISIGVKSAHINLDADSDTEVTRLIGEADLALLKAKANGRNRVEIFDGDFNIEKPKAPNSQPHSFRSSLSANLTH
ncbi:MAG TPA: diguanylate cyclase [Pseudobacteroides sp.]|uniref:GGDEF domain-containing response regulator n=1 Tax=Pseudobacteroides sp. TaxID=1968840 RepID=UPI002F91F36F